MSNFVPCGFDEDGHAPINSPLDPPRLVAVLDWTWCESCWTDTHDECGGKMRTAANVEAVELKEAA